MTDPARFLQATAGASAAICCIMAMCSVVTHAAPHSQPTGARASDPADLRALHDVCAQCHDLSMFADTIQSHDEWIDTIQKMVDRGARGTDDQFDRILHYLAENQTSVNVNAAPAEDIAPVLGVSDAVAQAVVARRTAKPFTDVADLLSVPGVDGATVRARRNRIGF